MGVKPRCGKPRGQGEAMTSPLAALRSEMNRLMDSFLRDPIGSLDWRSSSERGWSPTVDVAENEEEVTVRVELPGVGPEDLEITVTANELVLVGEKRESTDESVQDMFQAESHYGGFRRNVALPSAVDAEEVEAELSNGVLVVRLKKSPSGPAKRIDVNVKRP